MNYEIKRSIEEGARTFKETNDCTVRAVAACTEGRYAEAHALFAMHGRKHRRGSTIAAMLNVLKQMGCEVERVETRCIYYQNQGVKPLSAKTIRTFLRKRGLKGRKFILNVRGHVAAVVDGVCYDWTAAGWDGKPRQHRIIDVYEVKGGDAKPAPAPKPEPKPAAVAGNFVEKTYRAVRAVYGDNRPRRFNRRALMQVTGLAHGTTGHALSYLKRANWDLNVALEIYRDESNFK